MRFRVLFPAIALCFSLVGAAELDQKAVVEKTLASARKTTTAEPENGRAHVALAIALGKMTDFTDNRTKMSYARQIREEAETGLRLDPQNTDACLILGKWHDEMSRLNPVLRAIATTFYGKLPESSFVEAEKYLRRAVATAPENIQPRGELAEFLERQNRPFEAKIEWKQILRLQPRDEEDRAFLVKAKAKVP